MGLASPRSGPVSPRSLSIAAQGHYFGDARLGSDVKACA